MSEDTYKKLVAQGGINPRHQSKPEQTCEKREEGCCPVCGAEIRIYHMMTGNKRSIHYHNDNEITEVYN